MRRKPYLWLLFQWNEKKNGVTTVISTTFKSFMRINALVCSVLQNQIDKYFNDPQGKIAGVKIFHLSKKINSMRDKQKSKI